MASCLGILEGKRTTVLFSVHAYRAAIWWRRSHLWPSNLVPGALLSAAPQWGTYPLFQEALASYSLGLSKVSFLEKHTTRGPGELQTSLRCRPHVRTENNVFWWIIFANVALSKSQSKYHSYRVVSHPKKPVNLKIKSLGIRSMSTVLKECNANLGPFKPTTREPEPACPGL